jgi:hypothetical protein
MQAWPWHLLNKLQAEGVFFLVLFLVTEVIHVVKNV